MIESFHGRFSLTALCIVALLLLGCAVTEPARFYILEPLSETNSAAEPRTVSEKLTIGIGPVTLPDYLNRPQIVSRAEENELHLAEFHRWAEPLKDNISIVLIENLRTLLSSDGIYILPWKGASHVYYRLRVDFIRFDVSAAGEASLLAGWSLWKRGQKTEAVSKTSSVRVSVKGDGYNAMVSALNQTLTRFSREMAQTLRGLPE